MIEFIQSQSKIEDSKKFTFEILQAYYTRLFEYFGKPTRSKKKKVIGWHLQFRYKNYDFYIIIYSKLEDAIIAHKKGWVNDYKVGYIYKYDLMLFDQFIQEKNYIIKRKEDEARDLYEKLHPNRPRKSLL